MNKRIHGKLFSADEWKRYLKEPEQQWKTRLNCILHGLTRNEGD
jgi:hypothetical protein